MFDLEIDKTKQRRTVPNEIMTEPIILPASTRQPENTVADLLRDQILSGNFKEGEWLPTERQLAEDLNVHRSTVRMAINQLVQKGLVTRRPHSRPIVAAAVRAAHLEAAPSAQRVSSPSNLIALLTTGQVDASASSQERIFWGMNRALADAGYFGVFVDLGIIGSEQDNADREAEQLRFILKQGFGGAVFYPYAYRSNKELVEAVSQTIPLVTIDRRIESVDTDFVGVDNYQAMYDTIIHLIKQGHRRIAYLTKNEQIFAVQNRIQGYIDAIRDADLDEIVLSIPSRTEQEWTAVDVVFQMTEDKRPSAAAVFNDYSALDFSNRLTNMGLSVPGDVAITGFDSIISTLPTGVGLTSVAQPFEEIGRKAVEVLLRRLKDRSAPTVSVNLPAELIIRESSQYHGKSSSITASQ